MSVLAVGLSHRTASTDVLERTTLAGDALETALSTLTSGEHVAEAVVLSTCNRTEVYVNATTFHGGLDEATDLLVKASGLTLDELQAHLYVHHAERAVQHLFQVASGLDSVLVGESQIQGQIRSAYRVAEARGTLDTVLGELFRHALRVGKKARTDTAIDRAGASLVSVGLEGAGPLPGLVALVVGAGSTGALAAHTLRRAGVAEVVVANRTADRASALADAVGGRAVALGDLAVELVDADVVVCSTSATGFVMPADAVDAALEARAQQGLPTFVLDLAMPRDVDPRVTRHAGVTLVDLEQLRTMLAGRPAGDDVAAVAEMVDVAVADFGAWQRSSSVAPTVVALRAKAEMMVAAELDRLTAKLPDLDPMVRAELEHTVHRVVEKLLHEPTVRVKELASAPGGDSYAEALRELFGLDREAVSAVSAVLPATAPAVLGSTYELGATA